VAQHPFPGPGHDGDEPVPGVPEYEELAAVAEFTRRREQAYEASKARGDKPRHRDGEFPAEELGMELTCSYYAAGKRMDLADALSSRLPCTFAGMATGMIDGYKARIIAEFTRYLSDEQAAEADKVLAEAAPEMAPTELKKKAARLEYKLDPDGVRPPRPRGRPRPHRGRLPAFPVQVVRHRPRRGR
jgi:uncharacterized protein DUF222